MPTDTEILDFIERRARKYKNSAYRSFTVDWNEQFHTMRESLMIDMRHEKKPAQSGKADDKGEG